MFRISPMVDILNNLRLIFEHFEGYSFKGVSHISDCAVCKHLNVKIKIRIHKGLKNASIVKIFLT